MPRYFFDVTNAEGHQRDEVGDELDTYEDARVQAQVLLPDLTAEQLPDGDEHVVVCNVRDETGRVVYRGVITYKGTRYPD